jgi:hypothetical protein
VTSEDQSAAFQPLSAMTPLDKTVLQAAHGKNGPIFYTLNNLSTVAPIPPDYGDIVHQAASGELFSPYRPWIDSEVRITLKKDAPRVDFIWFHPNPPQTIWDSDVSLSLCPDLPDTLFRNPALANTNPALGGSALRVGRYLFLFSQVTDQKTRGVILLRRNALMDTAHFPRPIHESCGSFSETNSDLSAKWIELGQASIDTFKTTSAVATRSGIWLLYSTFLSSNQRLAFVDTFGVKTVVDSQSFGIPAHFYYFRLLGFQGRAWALANEGLVTLPSTPITPSTVQPLFLYDFLASPCAEVAGKCIQYHGSELRSLDLTEYKQINLDNTGIQDAWITGVVQYKDTVYVGTLSGVFTKPVARFFDPAK